MRLERLSCMPALRILAACLAIACFTFASQAQDTPPPQETPPQRDQRAEPQPDDSQRSNAQNGDAQEKIQINDRQRTFVVHLPHGYDSQQRYPVVILLHGLNQDAAEMARLTHFNELADRDSIIAVYPNATSGRWTLGGGGREPGPYRRGPYRRPGIWGPGYPPPPRAESPDRREAAPRNQDMQFLHRMLDRVTTNYSVDTRRIYAAGLGEGGFMAIRMGCTMADRSRYRVGGRCNAPNAELHSFTSASRATDERHRRSHCSLRRRPL